VVWIIKGSDARRRRPLSVPRQEAESIRPFLSIVGRASLFLGRIVSFLLQRAISVGMIKLNDSSSDEDRMVQVSLQSNVVSCICDFVH
jgi:hypothetical protein